MLYFTLLKSTFFNDKKDYDRFLRIITVGTITYVIIKMLLSSKTLFDNNNYGIYVYYLALLDLIICMYTFDITNVIKKKNEGHDNIELKKENNLVYHVSPNELLSMINDNNNISNQKIYPNVENNIFIPSNNNNNNNNNIFGHVDINKDIDDNIELIDNNNEDDSKVINTEIETESDEESYFIPIYRSTKKKQEEQIKFV
jgi:hypothetical protein